MGAHFVWLLKPPYLYVSDFIIILLSSWIIFRSWSQIPVSLKTYLHKQNVKKMVCSFTAGRYRPTSQSGTTVHQPAEIPAPSVETHCCTEWCLVFCSRLYDVNTKNMYSRAAQLCTVKATKFPKTPLAKNMQYACKCFQVAKLLPAKKGKSIQWNTFKATKLCWLSRPQPVKISAWPTEVTKSNVSHTPLPFAVLHTANS